MGKSTVSGVQKGEKKDQQTEGTSPPGRPNGGKKKGSTLQVTGGEKKRNDVPSGGTGELLVPQCPERKHLSK